jgi:hypothetical protein
VNESCRPPPLPDPSSLKCSTFPGAFTGAPVRQKPAKIGVLIKFAFESDLLEASLQQGEGLVDKFFIIEATRTNGDHTEKPLLLDYLLRQPRFAGIRDKFVRLVLDDTVHAGPGFDWESYHERARWEKFVAWNNVRKEFGPDDVLVFGDSDEIPSREIYQYLRYCTLAGPVDIGTWFTNSDVNTEFRCGWPIPGHPFLWGSPTVFTLAQASARETYPTRSHGQIGRSIWGGIHLTYYGYLPALLLKFLSMTESNPEKLRDESHAMLTAFQNGKSVSEIWKERKEYMLRQWTEHATRQITGEIERNGRSIPWFIKCNPGRYQYFYGATINDTRLAPGGVGCDL